MCSQFGVDERRDDKDRDIKGSKIILFIGRYFKNRKSYRNKRKRILKGKFSNDRSFIDRK